MASASASVNKCQICCYDDICEEMADRKTATCDMCSERVPEDDYELLLCRDGCCPYRVKMCEPCATGTPDGKWVCDKCDREPTFKCELCGSNDVSGSDYVGCCRDGDCPHRVEHMCEDCAFFNHASGEWLCGKCDVALEEADAAETAQEELIQFRYLLGSLSSKPSSESVEQLKDLLDRAIDLCGQIQIEAGK